MNHRWLRSVLAVWVVALLVLPPSYALRASDGMPPYAATEAEVAADRPAGKATFSIPDTGITEEQKILHALNRLGYGPRPGEVERIKAIGLKNYIEQQLQPETISNRAVEQRLAQFETLTMKSTELLAAYPPPQLLRGIERQLTARMGMDADAMNELFPELQRMRERRERQQGQAANPAAQGQRRRERMTPGERMERALRGPQRIVLELSQAKLLRAVYSERQLQEVMTDFWFNHFNVFIGKGTDRWHITSYERDAIRPHALGKFRDLLGATARHPAMLFYLDNWMSVDPEANIDRRMLQARYQQAAREQGLPPGGVVVELLRRRGMDTTQIERELERRERFNRRFDGANSRFARRRNRQRRQPNQQPRPQRFRGLNENYARELMELHTLGVEGGYTQQDIIEVARCFTGWTLLPLPLGQQFVFMDELHDSGTKVVLEKKIKNGGREDGEAVLDLLARHPSTARFISLKLARRFVSDAPPASLVEKMAETFQKSDGDVRAVLRTLFSSEEFWSPDAVEAKLKTPFEFVVSAARATEAEIAGLPGTPGGGPPGLVMVLRELGQPLYGAQPPTGYKDTADAWVSTGALLSRMKVALGLATNHLPGTQVGLPHEVQAAESAQQLVAQLGEQTLGRQPSEATQAALLAQLADVRNEMGATRHTLPPQAREMQARLALGWLLAGPEFQRK